MALLPVYAPYCTTKMSFVPTPHEQAMRFLVAMTKKTNPIVKDEGTTSPLPSPTNRPSPTNNNRGYQPNHPVRKHVKPPRKWKCTKFSGPIYRVERIREYGKRVAVLEDKYKDWLNMIDIGKREIGFLEAKKINNANIMHNMYMDMRKNDENRELLMTQIKELQAIHNTLATQHQDLKAKYDQYFAHKSRMEEKQRTLDNEVKYCQERAHTIKHAIDDMLRSCM